MVIKKWSICVEMMSEEEQMKYILYISAIEAGEVILRDQYILFVFNIRFISDYLSLFCWQYVLVLYSILKTLY